MKRGGCLIAVGVAWLAAWRLVLALGWDESAAVLGGTLAPDPITLLQLGVLLATTLTAPTLAPVTIGAGIVLAVNRRRS